LAKLQLTCNAILLSLVVLLGGGNLFAAPISEPTTSLYGYTLTRAADDVGGLYAMAIAWGLLAGVFWHWGPRSLAFLLRLTPVMPDEDVFGPSLLDLYKSAAGDTPAVWLKVVRERKVVFGKWPTSFPTARCGPRRRRPAPPAAACICACAPRM
jgi:hypothetical protein